MTAPQIDDITRPVVRLMPKANARAIRHGFPWVYANEMVTDRRTKALAPGSLAVLQDELRQPLGLVSVNPNSKIIARVLDTDPDAQLENDEVITNVTDLLWFQTLQALPVPNPRCNTVSKTFPKHWALVVKFLKEWKDLG